MLTSGDIVVIADGIVVRFEVSKCVWTYMASICIVYFVTLSLFPGIESEIISCRLGSWMPVVLIAVFNLFDFVGKVRVIMLVCSHINATPALSYYSPAPRVGGIKR